MRLSRRIFLASTLASVAAPGVLRLARANTPQFTFKLHHAFSSVSSGHDKFLSPWARKIEADAGGRIRIDIFPSMELGGAPAQLFDQARDGVADIVWAMPSDTPGRFPKIELFELPFVPSSRALVSSKAIDDYADANLKDEFQEVHALSFSCSDRGIVHANRPVQTIDEIKGLRLHVQTRFAADAVRALGANAVPMPMAQIPVAIGQHVIDGCVDPWDAVPALKLYDLLKTHTDFTDLSLSMTTFVLAMNKPAYDRLPADLKTVIDDNSGQVAAGMAGAMWDLQAAAVADMVSQRGEVITTLMPEAVAHWSKATEPVVVAWLKQMKEHRVDGEKLMTSAQDLLEKYILEPEPHPPPKPVQPPEQNVATQPQQPPASTPDVTAVPKGEIPPAAPTPAVTKPAAPAPPAPAHAATTAAPPTGAPVPSTPAPTPPTLAPVPPAPAPAAPLTPAPAAPVVTPAPAPASPPKRLDIPF